MQVEVRSEQSDLNKERNFYFRKTSQGRLVFTGIVIPFAAIMTLFYAESTGMAGVDHWKIPIVFVLAMPVSALFVIAGFLIMDSGYHVSAAWEGSQKREVNFVGSEVEFDGKVYNLTEVNVYPRPYEAYLVFGGSKVLYVSRYNCSEYNGLLSKVGDV